MLGYLMHKHPTHVLPHCLPNARPRGARRVLGVLPWENRHARVRWRADRLKQKKTVCSCREPPTYRLDSGSDPRPWEVTLAGRTERMLAGWNRFFFLRVSASGRCNFIGAIGVPATRIENWTRSLREFTCWGCFCFSVSEEEAFFCGRKKLLPQNAASVQDSFWVARFACAKPLGDYQCNRGTTNAN